MSGNVYKFPLLTSIDRNRFESKIDKSIDDCWHWNAGKNHLGYGQFWMDGKEFASHRVSYYLFNRTNPRNLFVLHKCDVPSCVNPDHLFLGTQKDNVRDAFAKGRRVAWNKGIRTLKYVNCISCGKEFYQRPKTRKWCSKSCAARDFLIQKWKTKTTKSMVRKIREEYGNGKRQCDLARKYKMKYITMHQICMNRNWKDV